MHKIYLLLFVLLTVASTVTLAQWNNNNNQFGFPNNGMPSFDFPKVDCNAPGANCHSVSVKCDSSGKCTQTKNSATTFSGVAVTMAISVGAYFVINFLR